MWVLMVFIHHAILFYLEAFSFVHFWIISTKILLSSVVNYFVDFGVFNRLIKK